MKSLLITITFTLMVTPLFGQVDLSTLQDSTFKDAKTISRFFTKTKGSLVKPQLGDLTMRLAINFQYDSDELSPKAQRQLDELATVLAQRPELNIELAGHTSTEGSEEYNDELSRRRVASAKNYLVKNKNITPDRLSTISYGERLPLIPNEQDETQREINRRTTVYFPEDRALVEQGTKQLHEELGFHFTVYHFRDGRQMTINLDGSSVLQSGERYRLLLLPGLPKYVYVFQEDRNGVTCLFPNKQYSDLVNPLIPNAQGYFLPSISTAFALDETIGREKIYFIVLDSRDEELEAFIDSKKNSKVEYSQLVSHMERTRGEIVPGKEDDKEYSYTVSGNTGEKIQTADPLTLDNPPLKNLNTVLMEYREFMVVLEFEHR